MDPLKRSDAPPAKDGRSRAVLAATDARAARNRALAAERTRERLKAGRMLGNLNDIDEELKSINDAVKQAMPVYDADGKPVLDPRTGLQMTVSNDLTESQARAYAVRIKALERRADIQFRKLAKVMPDLNRAILTDPNGGSPFAALSKALADAAQTLPALAAPNDA